MRRQPTTGITVGHPIRHYPRSIVAHRRKKLAPTRPYRRYFATISRWLLRFAHLRRIIVFPRIRTPHLYTRVKEPFKRRLSLPTFIPGYQPVSVLLSRCLDRATIAPGPTFPLSSPLFLLLHLSVPLEVVQVSCIVRRRGL